MQNKKSIILMGIFGCGLMLVVLSLFAVKNLDQNYTREVNDTNYSCNIAVVPISGELIEDVSFIGVDDELNEYEGWKVLSSDVVNRIEYEKEFTPEGFVFVIDSPGGETVAAERIAEELREIAVPKVALIRGIGASAGYQVASAADIIIASKYSVVGSIGITQSFVSNHKKNLREGYEYIELTTGAYKDLGSADKEVTKLEQEIILTQIKDSYEMLLDELVVNRGIDKEELRLLADGRTYSSKQAFENNLIDKIGSWRETQEYLTEQIGKEAVFCK